MPTERRVTVLDVSTQHDRIKGSNTLRAYKQLHDTHFVEDSIQDPLDKWLPTLENDMADPEVLQTSPEYFRLLGLVAILCAQYGFPSINGQVPRHRDRGFKGNVTDAKNQLALASYVGSLNEQVYQKKVDTAALMGEYFERIGQPPEYAIGVWGVMFKPESGQVKDIHAAPVDLATMIRTRALDSRPICLPDRELNRKLNQLNFTGVEPDEEFQTNILPEVKKIVTPFLDPVPVFEAAGPKEKV